MGWKDPSKAAEYNRAWNEAHPGRSAERARLWRIADPARRRAGNLRSKHRIKVLVLTAYSPGPEGQLRCSWDSCEVSDIDMLTLDHTANDGHLHLDSSGKRLSGIFLYRWVKKNRYPEGFQTLCSNHQLKKAIAVAKGARR